MLKCGEFVSAVHARNKKVAFGHVMNASELHSERSRRFVKGMGRARLSQRLSFVLQQGQMSSEHNGRTTYRLVYDTCNQSIPSSLWLDARATNLGGKEGKVKSGFGKRREGKKTDVTHHITKAELNILKIGWSP